jgi:hypothetical protein
MTRNYKILIQEQRHDGSYLTTWASEIREAVSMNSAVDRFLRNFEKDNPVQRVIFRKWYRRQDGTGIIALFPDSPWCNGLVTSFEHVGQHGGADYQGVIRRTRAATEDDYASLKRELEASPYGYRLKVVKHR